MPVHGFVSGAGGDVLAGKAEQPGPKHELVSHAATQSEARCVTRIDSAGVDPKYHECYPHEWALEVTWTVQRGELVVRYDVTNSGRAPAPMPFSIGNHLSLSYPFTGARSPAAYAAGLLRGTATTEHLISKANILSGETLERPAIRGAGLPLSTPFATDGVLSMGSSMDTTRANQPAYLELAQPGL